MLAGTGTNSQFCDDNLILFLKEGKKEKGNKFRPQPVDDTLHHGVLDFKGTLPQTSEMPWSYVCHRLGSAIS